MKNQILGSQGEQAAADFLQQQGYKICARNFRVPVGEIDIIARQGEVLAFVEVKTRHGNRFGTPAQVLAFVEVKTRHGNRYGTPAQAVNFHKQKKIIQTAQWFLRQKHLEDKCFCRFDVVEVYALPEGKWQVHHLPGAFEC